MVRDVRTATTTTNAKRRMAGVRPQQIHVSTAPERDASDAVDLADNVRVLPGNGCADAADNEVSGLQTATGNTTRGDRGGLRWNSAYDG